MKQASLERIRQHIKTLESKGERMKPYGGGNPYYYCVECQNSNVQGHASDCQFFKRKELIKDLKELIEPYSYQGQAR